MILACHGIQKSFGEHLIVRDGSFHIEDHEKAALVGPNGAGKSTLLKMIVGELAPDDGNVILTKGKTLGYLAQHQEMQSGNTIYEEVRTAKADIIAMERRIREIEMELKHLSGDALKQAITDYIRQKGDNLVGQMESQGTTPRRLTDLIGSLCDLTSGSGDKGTPIVYIQNYFDNYAK